MQIRKLHVATVFTLEPDFCRLLAAGVELSDTDFIWFVLPTSQVQLLVGGGGAGGGDRGEPIHAPSPPARTGHFELALRSSEFFLPLFGTVHEKRSCLLLFY